MERYRWLAAVIGAHPNREVYGRTRLQKTIKLLQSLGLPTGYSYMNYFYGPYSESLQADLRLVQQLGLVTENHGTTQDGTEYYVFTAGQPPGPEIGPYRSAIEVLSRADTVILELAATYQAFKELGLDNNEAKQRLRQKKGSKCDNGNEDRAMELLTDLGRLRAA
jgi:uncharacterized protein YwgA